MYHRCQSWIIAVIIQDNPVITFAIHKRRNDAVILGEISRWIWSAVIYFSAIGDSRINDIRPFHLQFSEFVLLKRNWLVRNNNMVKGHTNYSVPLKFWRQGRNGGTILRTDTIWRLLRFNVKWKFPRPQQAIGNKTIINARCHADISWNKLYSTDGAARDQVI